MDVQSFITNEALFIVPVLWILGAILKKTPKAADWMIPYILLVVGILLSVWTLGLDAEAIAQGVLVTGAAVLGHQLVQQARYKDE